MLNHDHWGDFATRVFKERYAFDASETWPGLAHRVSSEVFKPILDQGLRAPVGEIEQMIAARRFLPGGRYLYAAGRALHQTQNCLLLRAEDSREGWADLYWKHVMGLSTGAGIGTVYSDIRAKGTPLRRTGGVAGGPINLMMGINEAAHTVRQGGNRRAALWAGLHWWHADALEYCRIKDWPEHVRQQKALDWNASAPLDYTNQSVCYDDAFFAAITNPSALRHKQAHAVFWENVRLALRTGDPGFSIDVGENDGECLRNACTEVSSRDDSDICNIASLNLARYQSIDEFKRDLPLAVAFLVAGSVYSDLPYSQVGKVRESNRRLGLGLMGVHEWLVKRGKPYAPDAELQTWLEAYAQTTEMAHKIADEWSLSRPVKTRAMAPNGTIGIVAETTTCLEPLLAVAYKRRVKKGDDTWAQYVVDPVAQRLIQHGANPDSIETAYSLAESAEGVERRVAFQAWFQQYVDHGIASTINLPAWGSARNNDATVQEFGEMLLRYMPKLRGITVYPDGARGGQPITQVSLKTALQHGSDLVYETGDVCDLRGGNCG